MPKKANLTLEYNFQFKVLLFLIPLPSSLPPSPTLPLLPATCYVFSCVFFATPHSAHRWATYNVRCEDRIRAWWYVRRIYGRKQDGDGEVGNEVSQNPSKEKSALKSSHKSWLWLKFELNAQSTQQTAHTQIQTQTGIHKHLGMRRAGTQQTDGSAAKSQVNVAGAITGSSSQSWLKWLRRNGAVSATKREQRQAQGVRGGRVRGVLWL